MAEVSIFGHKKGTGIKDSTNVTLEKEKADIIIQKIISKMESGLVVY